MTRRPLERVPFTGAASPALVSGLNAIADWVNRRTHEDLMSEQRRAALVAAWDALRARRPHLPAGDSFDQGFAEAMEAYHQIMMGTVETGARLNSFVYELYERFPDAREGEGEPEARILRALDKRMAAAALLIAPGGAPSVANNLLACPMCGAVFLKGGSCPVCQLRQILQDITTMRLTLTDRGK